VIERIGVVVPAHNEEALLPACLEALRSAASLVDLPVHLVVVLDRCIDGSSSMVCAAPDLTVIEVDAGNVGIARAVGSDFILRAADATPPEQIWLATTDADSAVPRDWLVGQQALANAGWEVVIGTVEVNDWSEHGGEIAPRWLASYESIEDHPHIHGANFGCSGAAYLDAGGWPPLSLDEDVAMVESLAHRRVIRTAMHPVITSARRDPRAIGGFGDALRALAGRAGAFADTLSGEN
jgi:glycosyltransferase involved in cell wall biosynthesis